MGNKFSTIIESIDYIDLKFTVRQTDGKNILKNLGYIDFKRIGVADDLFNRSASESPRYYYIMGYIKFKKR